MRARLETLIDEMLEGQILLDEALAEFEKVYIKKALARNKQHLSNTAVILGIHRNTLAKRVALYDKQDHNGHNGRRNHGTGNHGTGNHSKRNHQ
jgi:DNA-binding NtrC family response regulator